MMSLRYKKVHVMGQCNIEGCMKSQAEGDRMVYHHMYETNPRERERYKSRVKTPISRLKESENPHVQERNREERSLCTTVCVHHHSILHAATSYEEMRRDSACLEERVDCALHMAYTHTDGGGLERMRKKLRRRLAELN